MTFNISLLNIQSATMRANALISGSGDAGFHDCLNQWDQDNFVQRNANDK